MVCLCLRGLYVTRVTDIEVIVIARQTLLEIVGRTGAEGCILKGQKRVRDCSSAGPGGE